MKNDLFRPIHSEPLLAVVTTRSIFHGLRGVRWLAGAVSPKRFHRSAMAAAATCLHVCGNFPALRLIVSFLPAALLLGGGFVEPLSAQVISDPNQIEGTIKWNNDPAGGVMRSHFNNVRLKALTI